jgi:predicted RNase H-like nuclease (RuvC/YqgF family)
MKNPATSPRSVNRLIQQIKNLSRLIENQEVILYQLESQIDQLGSQRKENDGEVAVYNGDDSKFGY